MSFRIIYGKSGTGKSSFIFNEIKQKIYEENKIYIITPEQFSFTAEKKLMESIGTGAVFNAEVLTFNRMAYRIMNEVGGAKKINLSSCGKSMLIYNILISQKSNLKFLGKSDENIELISTQITEFKKHGITPQDFENSISLIKNDYLKAKMNDMLIVYKEFENVVHNNFIDENDVLTILNNQLSETDTFKNSIIYIDEFVGFTKQEYDIIAKLMNMAKMVTINICTDSLELVNCPESDIFYANKQTADRLLKLAVSEKISIEKPIFRQNTDRFKNEELSHLEQNLYAVPYKKFVGNGDIQNIKLFLANNQYSEIEHVASQIVKIVKANDLRYRDISVITKNLDTYSNLCKVIFNKYDIPVFIDEKKDLSQNMVVRYVLSILEIFAKNWSSESVFNYVKTGFVGMDKDEIFAFENYCTKWGIKYSKWYKGEWNFGDEKEDNKAQIQRFRELRSLIVNPLIELKKQLKSTDNVKNITTKLYEFLIKNNISNKIEEKIKQLTELGKAELAGEYSSSWKIIMNVFDEIVLVFGNETVNFEKYMQLLKIGLGNSDLGKIPGTQDQVTVGDVDRSRSHKVKAIFIIGLNDGVFPSINKSEGFFNDSDREDLKNQGIELAKGTIERLYEDNFNIYKAFTTAEEKLFLSYSSSDSEGKSLRPSSLVTKVKKIFPNLKEESDIINKQSEVLLENTTFEELLNQLRDFRDGKQIDGKWFAVYKFFEQSDEWKQKLNSAIQALNYKNNPERITSKNIQKLYGNTLSTSVSRLEQYKSCPFSYFLKYELRLSDKDNFKVKPVDTGTFMHDVIDEFFNFISENSLSIRQIEDEQIEKIIEEIIAAKLGLNKNYIFTSTPKYQVLTQRLKRVVQKSIKYIVESIRSSDFDVLGNEVEFKKGKKYEPIKYNLDDGKTVEITGKIDRIDIGKFGDDRYIRIIDYKSSVKDIDLEEVYAGVQLQLLTYLDAVCEKEDVLPAGVLYFNLIDNIIKSNNKLPEEDIKEKIREQFKMKGLVLADIDIVKMMDKTLQDGGKSKIVPVNLNKDGSIKKNKSCISKEEFEYLQKYMTKIIKEISEEIMDGNIEIKPNRKKKRSPCEFCEYKSICNRGQS